MPDLQWNYDHCLALSRHIRGMSLIKVAEFDLEHDPSNVALAAKSGQSQCHKGEVLRTKS